MALTPEQYRDAAQILANALQHQQELFRAFEKSARDAAGHIEDVLTYLNGLDDNPPVQEPAEPDEGSA